jgi:hypothetical protein
MKHDKLRISKMVDELMNYFFSLGATDINVNVNEDEKKYKIFFKCNCGSCTKEKIDEVSKLLKCGKHEEMEEYYWALTGESDTNSELSLVGMMTDKSEVKFVPGDRIEITLYRNK